MGVFPLVVTTGAGAEMRRAMGIAVFAGMYQWLDRAPKRRNEMGVWWRRHDEYVTKGRR